MQPFIIVCICVILSIRIHLSSANPSVAENSFAFYLYRNVTHIRNTRVRGPKRNIVFSPYAIYTTLAALYEGSRGTTEEELKLALYIRDDSYRRKDMQIYIRSACIISHTLFRIFVIFTYLNIFMEGNRSL